MIKEFFDNIKNRIFENKKLMLIVSLGVIGIILISFSEFKTKATKTVVENETEEKETVNTDYAKNLEERLTVLISSIENAGQVEVMITLKSTDESVYAVNENIKNDDRSNNYSSNYVIIDNKSEKEGIKLKVLEPEIRGVAVVCTGGDNPEVVSQITDTVSTVLGIGSNKVSVAKMK